MDTVKFIVEAAKYYIGYTEKKGNSGFNNADFEKEMKSVGWYKGLAWCAFFVKLIYRKAYGNDSKLLGLVNRLNNGGALSTYNNHKANGTFEMGDIPKIGAIAIWQHGNSSAGHAGIVESFNLATNTMWVIEGNTNASGSREGDQVARKARTIKRDRTPNGLNLKGFIYPIKLS